MTSTGLETFNLAIELMELSVARAENRGSGDWFDQGSRLRRLRDRVDELDVMRARIDDGFSELESSRPVIVEVLLSSLRPEALEQIAEKLSASHHTDSTGGDETDPWLEIIDPDAYRRVTMRAKLEDESLRVAVVRGCLTFERTGEVVELRRAIRMLEAAGELLLARERKFVDVEAKAEIERMIDAIREVLPPPQLRFVARLLEERQTSEDESARLGGDRDAASSRAQEVEDAAQAESDGERVWFVPSVQRLFVRETEEAQEIQLRQERRERAKEARERRADAPRQRTRNAVVPAARPVEDARTVAANDGPASRVTAKDTNPYQAIQVDQVVESKEIDAEARLEREERQRIAEDEKEIAEAEREYAAKGLTRTQMKARGLLRPKRSRIAQPEFD